MVAAGPLYVWASQVLLGRIIPRWVSLSISSLLPIRHNMGSFLKNKISNKTNHLTINFLASSTFSKRGLVYILQQLMKDILTCFFSSHLIIFIQILQLKSTVWFGCWSKKNSQRGLNVWLYHPIAHIQMK